MNNSALTCHTDGTNDLAGTNWAKSSPYPTAKMYV